MGLYDTFIAKAICPYCQKEINNFQSKSFGLHLLAYKIGDRLIYCPIENGVMKGVAYDLCDDTKKMVYVDIKIKNCRFVGIGKPIKENQYQKETIKNAK